MEVNKISISPEDLVYQYLPVDYSDAYLCIFECPHDIAADDVQIAVWTNFPRWLTGLFKLRNLLVKPFRLQSGGSGGWSESEKENTIRAIRQGLEGSFGSVLCKSEDETILGNNDKHLNMYFSIKVTESHNDYKTIKATTLVKFHNWFGRVYFSLIFLFHRIIVRTTLKRVIRILSQKDMSGDRFL